MDVLGKLENWLAVVYKGSPKLSSSSKKSIIQIWPWVALIFGLIQLSAVFALWHAGHSGALTSNHLASNYYSSGSVIAVRLNIFYWFSLVVLLVDAAILLMAFPKLRKKAKEGWKLLFYGSILNLFYGVFSAFNNYGHLASLATQILVSGVVFYFLFQIRDQYRVAK